MGHLELELFKVIVQDSHTRFVRRVIQSTVLAARRGLPAVVGTGPRRTGKTTLLRRLFPRAGYVLLEDPDVQARARSDPRSPARYRTVYGAFLEATNCPSTYSSKVVVRLTHPSGEIWKNPPKVASSG